MYISISVLNCTRKKKIVKIENWDCLKNHPVFVIPTAAGTIIPVLPRIHHCPFHPLQSVCVCAVTGV